MIYIDLEIVKPQGMTFCEGEGKIWCWYESIVKGYDNIFLVGFGEVPDLVGFCFKLGEEIFEKLSSPLTEVEDIVYVNC